MSSTFGLTTFFLIFLLYADIVAVAVNNKCPDSVCHINIYSPKRTTRHHNVDNIVGKANNLKPFKLQILFTCAAHTLHPTPLICLKLHSLPCSLGLVLIKLLLQSQQI